MYVAMSRGRKQDTEAPVVQPKGKKFCQPPEETWKQIFPSWASDDTTAWTEDWNTKEENTVKICLHFWPTQLGDNKRVLSCKFVFIYYAATEN